jgi:endogenous inhibitor of DNA gyrase (YacG/DUF329 family)
MPSCRICGTELQGKATSFCSTKCKKKDQNIRQKEAHALKPFERRQETTEESSSTTPQHLTMFEKERIVQTILTHPEWKLSKVAHKCGVQTATVQRAWDRGWERDNIPPIKDTVAEVKARARARRAEKAFDERMELSDRMCKAVDYAVSVREEQGEILDSLRRTVKEGLLPELAQFVDQSKRLRELAARAIDDEISMYGTDPETAGLGHILDLQNQSILNFETGMKAVTKLFEAHKQVMGDAKEASTEQAKLDEAREWTLEELRAHRALIDGLIANLESQGSMGVPEMPSLEDLIGEPVHASQLN